MNTENQETNNVIENNQNQESNNENKPTEKLYTVDEVNNIVSKRLKKEKDKQEKALAEAKRLAELSEDDRVKEQLKLDREAFENERMEFLKEKMNVQAEKELINNGLPASFTKYVVTDEAESTLQNIKAFKSEWDKALEAAVKERIKSNAKVPKVQPEELKGNITWEDVLKDSKLLPKYKEQQRKNGKRY